MAYKVPFNIQVGDLLESCEMFITEVIIFHEYSNGDSDELQNYKFEDANIDLDKIDYKVLEMKVVTWEVDDTKLYIGV